MLLFSCSRHFIILLPIPVYRKSRAFCYFAPNAVFAVFLELKYYY